MLQSIEPTREEFSYHENEDKEKRMYIKNEVWKVYDINVSDIVFSADRRSSKRYHLAQNGTPIKESNCVSNKWPI